MSAQVTGRFCVHRGCVRPGDGEGSSVVYRDFALTCHWLSPGYPKAVHSVFHIMCAHSPAAVWDWPRPAATAVQDVLACCLIRVVSSVTWVYTDCRSAMSLRILRSALITVV